VKKRRLFVGGLPWAIEDANLKTLFEEGDEASGVQGCGSGSVEIAGVVRDRETGKSRGFAFITMSSVEKAQEAIKKFNGFQYQGRKLKVDEAADQSNNRRSGNEAPFRSTGNRASFSDSPFKQKKDY